MKKHAEVLTKVLEKSSHPETKKWQYGKVARIDEEDHTIYVALEGESANGVVPTKLANPCLDLEDLKQAIERTSLVIVDFNTLSGQPVIRDIFFSLSAAKKTDEPPGKEKTVHIIADNIILEGKKEVVIKSGDSKTVHLARTNKIKQEADKIHSSAKEWHKMQGSSVAIN